MDKSYFVYIITNKNNNVLYTGITNNLIRRIYEHKEKIFKGFSAKYNLNKLVYFECTNDVKEDINREKQIKGGSRKKKLDLINSMNPNWEDLYSGIH
jgi:putative endonuclease